MRLVATQDGFTVCVSDPDNPRGELWCFRIDKQVGAELVKRVNEHEKLAATVLGYVRTLDEALNTGDGTYRP